MKQKTTKRTVVFTWLLLSLWMAVGTNAYTQTFEWAKGMGGLLGDAGNAVAVDSKGNVYMTGQFQSDTINFNPKGNGEQVINVNTGSNDIFLAKYNAQGGLIWVKSMGGPRYDYAYGIAADKDDNVFITGYFRSDTADFNPGGSGGRIRTAGLMDVFLAKYDSDGHFLWAKSVGGAKDDQGYGVAVDTTGNVYITGGTSSDTAYFNPGGNGGMLITSGGFDVFLAKYDGSGNFLWAKSMGGNSGDYGRGVAADRAGNVYVTGYFNSATINFNPAGGGDTINNTGYNDDVFLAKYDANGNYLWSKGMGGGGLDEAYGVAVDSASNVYITGNYGLLAFFSPADFNPGGSGGVINSISGYDVFLAKYDKNGNFHWVRSMGGKDSDYGTGLTVDEVGNICLTGYFASDTAEFNPNGTGGELVSKGIFDIFLAKYDGGGNFRWAKSMGKNSLDYGHGIATDGSGNVYATGSFSSDTIDFNAGSTGGQLATVGGDDIFLLKLGCSDTTSSSLSASLPCGDTYELNGSVYSSEGIYTQVFFPNSLGCDSIVYLNLTVIPIDKPVINVNGFTLGIAGTHVYATYQWIKDGTPIAGATVDSYTVTTNGEYQVAVSNGKGCFDTSDVYTVNNAGIADAATLAYQVRVYPNPTNDMVYIQSPVNVNIRLTDIEGRIIRKEKGAASLSLKSLANGVYLLHITTKEGLPVKTEKVVKQD